MFRQKLDNVKNKMLNIIIKDQTTYLMKTSVINCDI